MKNDQKIQLSIWMISYNHASYIKKALDSVLMQETKYTYEIVISDDASNDGTANIIEEYAKKYPDRIRMYLSKKNYGTPRPVLLERNVELRGDYWCILETDDCWTTSDKIEKQLDFLYANKEYLGCNHAFLVKNEVTGTESIARASLPEWDIYDCLSNLARPTQSLYCHTSTWVWKNVFLNKQYAWIAFLKDEKLLFTKIFSDVLMHYRMLSYGGKVKHFDEVMSCYLQTGKGVWSSLSEEEQKQANMEKSFKSRMVKATSLKHRLYYCVLNLSLKLWR